MTTIETARWMVSIQLWLLYFIDNCRFILPFRLLFYSYSLGVLISQCVYCFIFGATIESCLRVHCSQKEWRKKNCVQQRPGQRMWDANRINRFDTDIHFIDFSFTFRLFNFFRIQSRFCVRSFVNDVCGLFEIRTVHGDDDDDETAVIWQLQ